LRACIAEFSIMDLVATSLLLSPLVYSLRSFKLFGEPMEALGGLPLFPKIPLINGEGAPVD
jgi:hypothetical protein